MGRGSLEDRLRRRQHLLDAVARHLLLGPDDAGYRWLTAAWAVAVAARLTLADVLQPDGLLPALCLVLSALGLLVWGGRLFWATSALGLAIPLFFLRDWLTQTVLMLLIASVGVLCSRRAAGSQSPILTTARGLAIATYFIAAFHKLNRDFLSPEVSCASATLTQLAEYLPQLPGLVSMASSGALPIVAIAFEVAVGGLLWWRPRLGVAVGLVFHLPLTLVLAPAFAFVMMIGYAASLGEADRQAVVEAIRARWRWLAPTTIASLGLLWGLMGQLPVWDMAIKQLWLLGWLLVTVLVLARAGLGAAGPALAAGRALWVGRLAVLVFVLLASTPYLGTQVQHTGAMLSNLRIDEGCWNHLVVPESVRRVDAYVRIDEARLGSLEAGTLGAYAETEALLQARLWNSVSLRQMRRNWCNERTRPIRLRGRFLGETLLIDDLCAEEETIPTGPGIFFGGELFSDYLRFQKNLERRCPQACIH